MTHLSNICYPLFCVVIILSVIVLMCMHFSYLILKMYFYLSPLQESEKKHTIYIHLSLASNTEVGT